MLTKKRIGFIYTPIIISCIIFVYECILLHFTNSSGRLNIILLFSVSAGMAVSFLLSLTLSNRISHAIGSVILSVLTIAYITETLLKRSFGYYYPVKTITGMAGEVAGSYGGTIWSTILSGLIPILLSVGITLLFIIPGKRLTFHPRHKIFTRSVIFVLIFVFHFAALGVLNAENNSNGKALAVTDRDYYKSAYDFNEAVPRFGLLTTMRLDLYYSIFGIKDPVTDDLPDENIVHDSPDSPEQQIQDIDFERLYKAETDKTLRSLHSYLSSVPPTTKNEYTGIFKGKNLIFICAEALSPYAVSPDITPTLYKLTHSGFVFSDYYQPSFGESTSGGEYSLLLSQIPKRDSGESGMSMQLACSENLRYSLPGLFAKNGYRVQGYHNNSYTYYSRNITHPKMGMDWYGCGGSVTEDKNDDFNISEHISPGWPRSDDEMIKATVNRYIAEDSPFFCYYMSVSGHNNYSFSENSMSRKNKNITDSLGYSDRVKAYIACQYELEKALTTLISELEANGKLADTVIALSNDHYPYGLSPTWQGNAGTDPLSELYGTTVNSIQKREKGILFIWNSEIRKPIDVSKPVCSVDVMPTLLNLFGMTYDSRLLAGRDALSDGDGLVFFSDLSWKTSKAEFNAKTGKISISVSGVDDDYISNISQEVKKRIQYSKLIRRKDYFKALDGYV